MIYHPDWKTIAAVPIVLMLWLFVATDCRPETVAQRSEAGGLIAMIAAIALLKTTEFVCSKRRAG